MKTITLLAAALCLAVSSCETANFGDASIIYTGDGVEIGGLTGGDVLAAGYSPKTKTGYLVFNDGTRENLKVVGGGYGAGKLILVLEGGSRITVDVKTATVTRTAPPTVNISK